MVFIMQLYMKDQLIAEIDENTDSATKISQNNGDLLTYEIHIKEFKKAFSYRYASKPFQEKIDIGQQRIDIRQHKLIINTIYKPTPRRAITKNDTFYLIFESYDNESYYVPIMLDKCLMIYPEVKVIENEENKLIKQHSMMQKKIDEMQKKIEVFEYVVKQFNNEIESIEKLLTDINKCDKDYIQKEIFKTLNLDNKKIEHLTYLINNISFEDFEKIKKIINNTDHIKTIDKAIIDLAHNQSKLNDYFFQANKKINHLKKEFSEIVNTIEHFDMIKSLEDIMKAHLKNLDFIEKCVDQLLNFIYEKLEISQT